MLSKKKRKTLITTRHMRRLAADDVAVMLTDIATQSNVHNSDLPRHLPENQCFKNIPEKVVTANSQDNDNSFDTDNSFDSVHLYIESNTNESDCDNEKYQQYTVNANLLENFEDKNEDFKKFIANWAVTTNSSHAACNKLLSGLRKFTDYDLPKDIRTLLKTPKESTILPMGHGYYCHFGLKKIIIQMVKAYTESRNYVNLLINIDGLPLSKSSKACLWPILCSNFQTSKVYIIGAYFGQTKPENANFLRQCVDELKDMINDGFEHKNKLIQINVHALICDAPAKAFVLGIKGHTGFNSCSKCVVEGVRCNNRICFPSYQSARIALRTDEGFRNNIYGDYHVTETILKEIPRMDLIQNVPLDYMHLICLGIVKKLIFLWIESGPLSIRLRPRYVENISKLLTDIQKKTPHDFGRKPRALSDYRQWKAIEFRTFLLYTGPVVLQSYLKHDIYVHFLSLHVATSILISPIMSKIDNYISYAESLLIHFVKSFELLYGKCFVSHNVHNLTHICNDVRKFGPLDSFSAFRFENYLSSIKGQLRKSEKPLQQLWRRYTELEINEDTTVDSEKKPVLSKTHNDGPIIGSLNIVEQYKIYNNSSYSIQCHKENDSFCLLSDDSCIYVHNIVKTIDNKIFVLGRLLQSMGSLYSLPCDSEKLNIRYVSTRVFQDGYWPVTDIMCKAWAIPRGNVFVIVPILHSLSSD